MARDVVTCLAAHQQNLDPGPAVHDTLLLALPPPALCTRLVPQGFAAWRQERLSALAAELGGGDGPVPVVTWPNTELRDWLGAQRAAGVRRLALYGASDQPGLAREVARFWAGALWGQPGSDQANVWSDLAPLFDDPRPLVWLGPALCRVACRSLPVPAGVEALAPAAWPDHPLDYAWDPERRLGWAAGTLPVEALRAEGEAQRSAWAAHWGDPDLVRRAVLGLDAAVEAALWRPVAPVHTPGPACLIAVTGLDGAGKSTQVARLAAAFAADGQPATPTKLYRQGGFLALADRLSARTARGAPLACFRVSRLVKLTDSLRVWRDEIAPRLGRPGVVVADRWVETHRAAAGSQLGWDLRQSAWLAAFPVPEHTVWLELPVEVALARLDARAGRRTADEHPVGLRGYAEAFGELAQELPGLRIDAQDGERKNAARIAAVVGLGGAVTQEDVVASAHQPAPPQRPGTRCRVWLGGGEGAVLGSAFIHLLTLLPDPEAIPLGPRLEAWAADVLLELLVERPTEAVLPVAPGVLARLPAFQDCPALVELQRLIAAEVEFVGCGAGADAEFLAALGPGAGRWLGPVRRAQAAFAEEEGIA